LFECSLSCPEGGERRALQGPEAAWRRATVSPTNDENKLRPLLVGVKSHPHRAIRTPSNTSTAHLDRVFIEERV